jgi:type VI secretion system protein VasD
MRFTSVVIVCGSLLLSACGAWQAISDTGASLFTKRVKVVNVDFKARDLINPDERQKALPVAVRVYQLRDRKAFDAATYSDLLKNDRTMLAPDLLDSHGVIVIPGGAASVSQPMQEDTRFVAVAVFFRDATVDADWRRVVARKALSADDPLKFTLLGSQLIGANDVPAAR